MNWQKHTPGDDCPVDPGTLVAVRFANGRVNEFLKKASAWDWTEEGPYGIVEYSVADQPNPD